MHSENSILDNLILEIIFLKFLLIKLIGKLNQFFKRIL